MGSDMNGLESVQHIGLHIVSLSPHSILSDPIGTSSKCNLNTVFYRLIAAATIIFGKQKDAATKQGWILYEGSH